jgi:hypothetical protein
LELGYVCRFFSLFAEGLGPDIGVDNYSHGTFRCFL